MLGHISEHVDQVGNIDGSIYVVTGLCSHDNFERERNKMSNMINVVCSRLAQTGYSCFRFARPMFAHTKQSSLFVSLLIIMAPPPGLSWFLVFWLLFGADAEALSLHAFISLRPGVSW